MISVNNKTAIKYFQTIPHTVKMGNNHYTFVVQANICLCWVDNWNVERILSKTKSCCGGNKNRVYRLANESDVRRWTNKGGR